MVKLGKYSRVYGTVLDLPYVALQFWLVVWNIFYSSIQLGISSSQLTFIFFRGLKPPTRIIFMSFVITVRFLLIAVGVFGSMRCSHEEVLSFDTLVATHSAVVLGSGEVPSRDVHFCALLLHHWPKIPRYQ